MLDIYLKKLIFQFILKRCRSREKPTAARMCRGTDREAAVPRWNSLVCGMSSELIQVFQHPLWRLGATSIGQSLGSLALLGLRVVKIPERSSVLEPMAVLVKHIKIIKLRSLSLVRRRVHFRISPPSLQGQGGRPRT